MSPSITSPCTTGSPAAIACSKRGVDLPSFDLLDGQIEMPGRPQCSSDVPEDERPFLRRNVLHRVDAHRGVELRVERQLLQTDQFEPNAWMLRASPARASPPTGLRPRHLGLLRAPCPRRVPCRRAHRAPRPPADTCRSTASRTDDALRLRGRSHRRRSAPRACSYARRPRDGRPATPFDPPSDPTLDELAKIPLMPQLTSVKSPGTSRRIISPRDVDDRDAIRNALPSMRRAVHSVTTRVRLGSGCQLS